MNYLTLNLAELPPKHSYTYDSMVVGKIDNSLVMLTCEGYRTLKWRWLLLNPSGLHFNCYTPMRCDGLPPSQVIERSKVQWPNSEFHAFTHPIDAFEWLAANAQDPGDRVAKKQPQPESSVLQVLAKTDWALLRDQKQWLLTQPTEEAAGLVHWIDAIQDSVVDTGLIPDDTVFGPTDSDE